MRKIGIVGGLSPESTTLYYRTIINEYREKHHKQNYPIIIIYSVSFDQFREYWRSKKYEKVIELLLKAIRALGRAGADFALISANTSHMFYNEVEARSPIPLLNIIDCLAEVAKMDGISKIGLLGTKYTLTLGFYSERLRKHGLEAFVPEKEDIDIVNDIIFNELTWGIIREGSRRKVMKIMEKLKEKGSEAVALACTELPLLFRDTREIYGMKLYDTAKIHAVKALDYALGKNACFKTAEI